MISFPISAKVCETTSKSSLQDFNPLNDSEPNLEFDMTDQDNAENPDLHVKLIQDARTRKWQVKIRNLTQEQVDFIAGPRLLPTLTKTDAVVIEHHDTTLSKNHDECEQPPASASDNLAEPNSAKSNSSSAASVQNENFTNSDINEIPPSKSDIPTAGPRRPRRSTAKNINYSTMAVIDDPANSDSDEYLPKALPLPKLNNKRTPSASRIVAQSHKKHRTDHDEPKDKKDNVAPEPQDPETTTDNKSMKGELNIKTVSLPKRVRAAPLSAKYANLSATVKRRGTRITGTITAR